MQDTLFSGRAPESVESIGEINEELLRRAKKLPQFKERVFIFGEGGAGAKAAVVGESPGPPDIESGRPFMGPAGQMLERILGSIGLARSDCYLTNVIKVISQGDEITPEWLSFFTPYLHRELAAASPDEEADLAVARRVPRLRRDAPDADLQPGLPPARPDQEARGLGGHEEGSHIPRLGLRRASPRAGSRGPRSGVFLSAAVLQLFPDSS